MQKRLIDFLFLSVLTLPFLPFSLTSFCEESSPFESETSAPPNIPCIFCKNGKVPAPPGWNISSISPFSYISSICSETDSISSSEMPMLSIICLTGPIFNSIAHLTQSPSLAVLSPSTFVIKNTAGYFLHLVQIICFIN